MNYEIYKPATSSVVFFNQFKYEHLNLSPKDALLRSISDGDQSSAIHNMTFLALEHRWRNSGSPVMFLSSKDLAASLSCMVSDVSLKDINLPLGNVFSVAFPKGTVAEGLLLRPFLFSVANIKDIAIYDRQLVEYLGLSSDFYDLLPEYENDFSIILIPTGVSSPLLNIYVIDTENLFLKLKSLKSFEDGLETMGEYGPTTSEDRRLAMAQMRLAIGCLVYAQCYPNLIRDGIPSDLIGRGEISRQQKTFSLEELESIKSYSVHGSPSPHHRRMHFRALRDDRFRRNEDGSVRIIEVKESLVMASHCKTEIENY